YDYTAHGSVANMASRLCDAAASGQILVSPAVKAAVDELVETEPAGDLDLKGVTKPVGATNVVSLRWEAPSLGGPTPRGSDRSTPRVRLSRVAREVRLTVRADCVDDSCLRRVLTLEVSVPKRSRDGSDDVVGRVGRVLEWCAMWAAVQGHEPLRRRKERVGLLTDPIPLGVGVAVNHQCRDVTPGGFPIREREGKRAHKHGRVDACVVATTVEQQPVHG